MAPVGALRIAAFVSNPWCRCRRGDLHALRRIRADAHRRSSRALRPRHHAALQGGANSIVLSSRRPAPSRCCRGAIIPSPCARRVVAEPQNPRRRSARDQLRAVIQDCGSGFGPARHRIAASPGADRSWLWFSGHVHDASTPTTSATRLSLHLRALPGAGFHRRAYYPTVLEHEPRNVVPLALRETPFRSYPRDTSTRRRRSRAPTHPGARQRQRLAVCSRRPRSCASLVPLDDPLHRFTGEVRPLRSKLTPTPRPRWATASLVASTTDRLEDRSTRSTRGQSACCRS